VLLDDLKLVGLRASSAKESTGQQFSCPNCGSPVAVTLATSKSITCGSCHTLIDLSQGMGGQLQHALQDEPVRPLIALGAVGTLQNVPWQVVGFQHRMGREPGDDESFGWSEYLLYNKTRGFCFLVDAEDGWSVVKPTTGAPSMSGIGSTVAYLGAKYTLKSTYSAETTYVAGEFYWPVVRGQTTQNRDFANGKTVLSLEQTAKELTWSSGTLIDSAAVAQAFKLTDSAALLQRGTAAAPAAALTAKGCLTLVVLVLIILFVLWLLSAASQCDPNTQDCRSGYSGGSSRSSGGSFGGFSGGGGHK
jgi:hypothetical protein